VCQLERDDVEALYREVPDVVRTNGLSRNAHTPDDALAAGSDRIRLELPTGDPKVNVRSSRRTYRRLAYWTDKYKTTEIGKAV
jgi:hypothetical protein